MALPPTSRRPHRRNRTPHSGSKSRTCGYSARPPRNGRSSLGGAPTWESGAGSCYASQVRGPRWWLSSAGPRATARPRRIPPKERPMIRRLLLAGTALTAACAPGSRGTPTAAAPALTPAPGVPPTEGASAHRPDVVRYGPSALRYVVHRRLHIQQALGDQTQAQDVGARIFVATAITGPADSIGYPATFLVDSIVADSGTPPPIVDNINKVRKLVFAGRVASRGEFVNALASDSAVAQSVVQLLGNCRDQPEGERLRGVAPRDHALDGGGVGGPPRHPRRAGGREPDLSGRGGRQERGAAVRPLRCRNGQRSGVHRRRRPLPGRRVAGLDHPDRSATGPRRRRPGDPGDSDERRGVAVVGGRWDRWTVGLFLLLLASGAL